MSKNTLNWFEINVSNLDAAAKLYGTVLQTELKREVLFGIPHAVFVRAGGEDGMTGALISDPKRARGHAGTVNYFAVPDSVRAAMARALEAGGKEVLPPTPIAPFGTIGVFADLDGNHIGLHTPE